MSAPGRRVNLIEREQDPQRERSGLLRASPAKRDLSLLFNAAEVTPAVIPATESAGIVSAVAASPFNARSRTGAWLLLLARSTRRVRANRSAEWHRDRRGLQHGASHGVVVIAVGSSAVADTDRHVIDSWMRDRAWSGYSTRAVWATVTGRLFTFDDSGPHAFEKTSL